MTETEKGTTQLVILPSPSICPNSHFIKKLLLFLFLLLPFLKHKYFIVQLFSNHNMSQQDNLNDPSPLRFYMQRNPNLTLQECLVAFREYSDEQIQSNFHKNVTAIKKGFDLEIKTRAKNPVTFDQLSSNPK